MSSLFSLTVDGQPVEALPSQILLRASQCGDPTALLRPHDNPDTTASDELLRPSQEEQSSHSKGFSWEQGAILEADSFEGSVSDEVRRQRDEE